MDTMRHIRILVITAAALGMSINPAASCADGWACAVVKETPDHFVALRSEPSTNATIVTRLQPYEILVVEISTCELPYWQRVDCVPRLDKECYLQSKAYTRGWVHKRLISLTACPKDMN